MKFSLHILSDDQAKVWEKLGFMSDLGFYLGGGTAAALQIGHRTSLDFDFYNPGEFANARLSRSFRDRFSDVEAGENQPVNTWHGKVAGVEVSAFLYQYNLLGKLVELSGVKMASLEDIAAMKVAAVVQRARQRDFVDIYYLGRRLGMAKVIEAAERKYSWYQENEGVVLTSLVYFLEADKDPEAGRIKVFDKSVTWEKVKSEIAKTVQGYVASRSHGL